MRQGETYQQDQARASRVTLTVTDDTGEQQTLSYKGVAGEAHSGVLRIQSFGFNFHAPAGSEAVVLSLGNRDMPVVLGGESPAHKPTGIPEGGGRIYDTSGSYVDFDAAGNIVVVSSTSVTIRAANITLDGNLTVNGDITHNGNMTTSGTHVDSIGGHDA